MAKLTLAFLQFFIMNTSIRPIFTLNTEGNSTHCQTVTIKRVRSKATVTYCGKYR
jgi:hypothetical protein